MANMEVTPDSYFQRMFVEQQNSCLAAIKAGSCVVCQSVQCRCPRTNYVNNNVVFDSNDYFGSANNSERHHLCFQQMNSSNAASPELKEETSIDYFGSAANNSDSHVSQVSHTVQQMTSTSSNVAPFELQEETKRRSFFYCRVCKIKCSRLTYYDRHWKQAHSDIDAVNMFENPSLCEECGRYFPNRHSLQSHIGSTHRKSCDKNSVTYSAKLQNSRPPQVVKRYCPLCGFIVDGYRELEKHLDYVHGGLRVQHNNSSKTTNKTPKSVPPPPKELVICTKCGLVCHDQINLTNHSCRIPSSVGETSIVLACNPKLKSLVPVKIQNQLALDGDVVSFSQNKVVSVVQPYEMYPLVYLDEITTDAFVRDDNAYNDDNIILSSFIIKDGFKSEEIDNVYNTMQYNSNNLNSFYNGGIIDESNRPHASTTESGSNMVENILSSVISKSLTTELFYNRQHCSICRYTTYSKATLQQHMQLIHGHKTCPVCDYSSKISDLLDHLKTVHSYESDLNMSDNPLELKFSNNNNSSTNHRKRNPVVCRICGISYMSVSDYRNHFLKHHAEYSQEEMFDNGWKCSQCFRVCRNLRSLQCHWIKQHKETYSRQMFLDFAKQTINETQSQLDSVAASSRDNSPNMEDDVKNGDSFTCTMCFVQCVDKEQLLLHQSLVHFDCTEAISLVDVD